MLLQNLLVEYLLELKLRNYSERTIKSVRNNSTLFFYFLKSQYGVETIEKLNKTHIKAHLKYKCQLGLKPTYVNSILKNIRMFFNYLFEEEYIKENYAFSIHFQKETKTVIETFTEKEVKDMLKVYGYDTFLHARNKCIIAMLFDTGIRNLELCSMKCEDMKENAILIHGKGDKERVVPISPFLKKIMLKYEQKRNVYRKERYQDEYYFFSQKGKKLTVETVENILKNCGKEANVNKAIRCSPHTCRHTFAQMQVKNGLDVYSLSRILGHENISITKRYLQSMRDIDILKLAVKSSPLMNL